MQQPYPKVQGYRAYEEDSLSEAESQDRGRQVRPISLRDELDLEACSGLLLDVTVDVCSFLLRKDSQESLSGNATS